MSNTQSQDTKQEASEQPQQQKPTVLEEDDEFEDFPVDGENCPPFTSRHFPYPSSFKTKTSIFKEITNHLFVIYNRLAREWDRAGNRERE